jgi:hypothetical protein
MQGHLQSMHQGMAMMGRMMGAPMQMGQGGRVEEPAN